MCFAVLSESITCDSLQERRVLSNDKIRHFLLTKITMIETYKLLVTDL